MIKFSGFQQIADEAIFKGEIIQLYKGALIDDQDMAFVTITTSSTEKEKAETIISRLLSSQP